MDKAVFKIEGSFLIEGRGVVVAGVVASGTIRKGMRAVINGKTAEVIQIESANKIVEVLLASAKAGLLLSGVQKDDIKLGEVLFT